jgi:hypothetical protein
MNDGDWRRWERDGCLVPRGKLALHAIVDAKRLSVVAATPLLVAQDKVRKHQGFVMMPVWQVARNGGRKGISDIPLYVPMWPSEVA